MVGHPQASPPPDPGIEPDSGAWFWLWDVYYVLGTVAVALVAFVSAHAPPRSAVAAGCVLTLLLWYWAVGRPHIRAGRQDRTGWLYVAGMVAILSAAAWVVPESAFALFVACPMAFMALPLRQALIAVGVLNLAPLGIAALHGPARLAASVPTVVLGLGFAVLAGTYLDRTIRVNDERARLIAELRASRAEVRRLSHQAGVDAERARLAGEIHDTLAQGFTSVIALVQAAHGCLDDDPARARDHLDLTIGTARENLAEARTLVAALAPGALDAGSLQDALAQLVGTFRAHTDTGATFTTTGEPRRMPTAEEVVALRTAQEALANARRHAQAESVHVELAYLADRVKLTVCDDGAGFAQDAHLAGYGLAGMASRANQVGAHLEVRSSPGRGTTVTLVLSG